MMKQTWEGLLDRGNLNYLTLVIAFGDVAQVSNWVRLRLVSMLSAYLEAHQSAKGNDAQRPDAAKCACDLRALAAEIADEFETGAEQLGTRWNTDLDALGCLIENEDLAPSLRPAAPRRNFLAAKFYRAYSEFLMRAKAQPLGKSDITQHSVAAKKGAAAEWERFFNTWEVARIVDEVRRGYVSILGEIANNVIPGIEAYLRKIDTPNAFVIDEVKAASELKGVCERIAMFNDEATWSGPIHDEWRDLTFATPGVRGELAELLEKAWFIFIAECAGPHVYIKQPAERKARAKGAQSTNRNQRKLIDDAIRRFDPGPGTGTKKSRVAAIIKEAEKAEFEGRQKLPIRLDKYLP